MKKEKSAAPRPKGSMLTKKLLRDMRVGWKSFAAVFIICMLSVGLYCGIDASWRGMGRNLDYQFASCNLADLWVSGEVSDRMAAQIGALPGVADAQRRVSVRGVVKSLPQEPKLEIYMSEGLPRINRPMVLEGGELPADRKNVVVLGDAFAEANGFAVGDPLTVEVAGQRLELLVAGIGYQAEYVVYSDGASFRMDPETFGYAFLSPGTLSYLPYGELSIRLAEGANQEQIKTAIEEMLDDPQKKVLTRDDRMGIKMAVEEVEQVRAIGSVFPVVFFLVAALITWSTMKRLVDNQRQQIGTLRSQGYTQGQLVWHYTSYGLSVSIFAVALGLVVGYLLGEIIVDLLRSIYVLPGAHAYLDPLTSALIGLLVLLIASGASYLSCFRSLREMPAALLRPKPPARGRRVFLERIPFLWRMFSFSNKMIIRNMFRNLSRFFIGMLGVVGCTALLLTGFGMRDSVAYVLDHHYGYTMRYDARATLDTQGLSDAYLDALRERAGAERMEGMMETGAEVRVGGSWQAKMLYVLENGHDLVYLEDLQGGRKWVPERGVAITEKFSEDTGFHLGDVMEIRMPNGHTAYVEVRDIINIQLGQGIYISREEFRRLDVMPYSPTALLLQGGAIEMEALADMDGVDTVRTLQGEKDINGMVVEVLDLVVMLMVIFAGALALVVLFTLGQLNFFERQRELATLMVLGFFPRENKRIILRENLIIAVLGLPIGLFLGPYLHDWVLRKGLPNTLEFFPYIAPESWVFTVVLTLFFAQVVNWFIGSKFKKVDMVEALKSVE